LKLLIDENLAPRLADGLAELFPGSIHVSSAELERIVRHNAIRFTDFENDAKRSLLILN
jgi:hypothetical protein